MTSGFSQSTDPCWHSAACLVTPLTLILGFFLREATSSQCWLIRGFIFTRVFPMYLGLPGHEQVRAYTPFLSIFEFCVLLFLHKMFANLGANLKVTSQSLRLNARLNW